MGNAFGELMRALAGKLDILQVDPHAAGIPEARRSGPARRAWRRAPESHRGVLERNRELAGAGYHAQVHMEEQTSLVFLLENGKRLALAPARRGIRPERAALHRRN